jgi:hypothetical protein
VAISGDTLVVGARYEASNATGVNGNQNVNFFDGAGAAYVYVRSGTNWSQQAYLKASNTGAGDRFGYAVAVDGDTIVIGATFESSNATGVNGDQSNNGAFASGAVYVFVRSGTNWTQQAYLKASNTGAGDQFGGSVAISGDTIVVGAMAEDSSTGGVNSDQDNNSAVDAGAAYVFVRSGTNWSQQAYLKAFNPEGGGNYYPTPIPDNFGISVRVSGDTVVVGAPGEDSAATGVDGDQNDNSAPESGAAYVFVRSGTNWSQQAYLKPSNTAANDRFGWAVATSGDTVVVGAYARSSGTGAAYIFTRSGTRWTQQAFLSGTHPPTTNQFGYSVAVSNNTVVVGANAEDSAYVYTRSGTNWTQQAQLKASNVGDDDFGCAVSVWGDTVVVGAFAEDSNATGVNGNQSNNSSTDSGAAYVFTTSSAGVSLSVASDGASGYFIRCNGTPDVTYQLHRSPTVTGPWTTNATFTAVAPGVIEFHDTNAPSAQAFYRVVSQ